MSGTLYRIKELASVVFHDTYSEEDYQAFLEYNKSKSHFAIMMTCLIPVFAVSISNIVSLMIVPLRPVIEGFTASISLPILVFMGPCAGCAGFVFVLLHYFPGYSVKWYVMTTLCIASGTTNLVFLWFLTRFCWPFPMSVPVPVNAVLPVIMIGVYFSVLKEAVKKEKNFWLLLKCYVKTMFTIWNMMLIYPLIMRLKEEGVKQSEENGDTGTADAIQFISATVLFIVRRVLKKIVISICENAERPAPFLAVIGIDAFHVVYVSILLGDGAPISIVVCIMLYDTVNNIIQFRKIKEVRSRYPGDLWEDYEDDDDEDSPASAGRLRSGTKSSSRRSLFFSSGRLKSSGKVAAGDGEPKPVKLSKKKARQIEVRKKILQMSENLILLEYIECIIPAILAMFSIWFYIYPVNRPYFRSYKNMTDENFITTQITLWTYAFSEFILLKIMTQMKVLLGSVDTPMWGQLGYVLTKQIKPTIALISLWILYANTMSVAHLGSDVALTCNPPPE